MRSGKTTVASHLVGKYGYLVLPFAEPLKEEVARGISNYPGEFDPGDLEKEPLKSQIRPVLQAWGTDFRRRQDPDYWINEWREWYDYVTGIEENRDAPVVVPDTRFKNELYYLDDLGFKTAYVDMSRTQVIRQLEETTDMTSEEITARNNHISETDLEGENFHIHLVSIKGDVEGLLKQVDLILGGR
jgi:hypothetical protein